MITLVRTASTNPFHNLALEEVLLGIDELGPTLYLWQNQNTVVIGKHQNAWKECNIDLLNQEGGTLARRSTGGGAVFHDLGNLNFTFVMPAPLYDVKRQCGVVLSALQSLGIDAEMSGRNDLTIQGAKFSGNAFKKTRDRCIHHGTLLYCVDMQKLGRYLQPSKLKLQSKGVDSVVSRVTNLCEHHANLTLEMLIWAMERTFTQEYGPASRLTEKMLDEELIKATEEKYASWEWRFGTTPQFDIEFDTRFDFGCLTLAAQVSNGVVTQIKVFSDMNDEAYICAMEEALCGSKWDKQELIRRIATLDNEMTPPIIEWINTLEI